MDTTPRKSAEDTRIYTLCVFTTCLAVAFLPIYLVLRRLIVSFQERTDKKGRQVKPEPYESLSNEEVKRFPESKSTVKSHTLTSRVQSTNEKLARIEDGPEKPPNEEPSVKDDKYDSNGEMPEERIPSKAPLKSSLDEPETKIIESNGETLTPPTPVEEIPSTAPLKSLDEPEMEIIKSNGETPTPLTPEEGFASTASLKSSIDEQKIEVIDSIETTPTLLTLKEGIPSKAPFQSSLDKQEVEIMDSNELTPTSQTPDEGIPFKSSSKSSHDEQQVEIIHSNVTAPLPGTPVKRVSLKKPTKLSFDKKYKKDQVYSKLRAPPPLTPAKGIKPMKPTTSPIHYQARPTPSTSPTPSVVKSKQPDNSHHPVQYEARRLSKGSAGVPPLAYKPIKLKPTSANPEPGKKKSSKVGRRASQPDETTRSSRKKKS